MIIPYYCDDYPEEPPEPYVPHEEKKKTLCDSKRQDVQANKGEKDRMTKDSGKVQSSCLFGKDEGK